MPRLYRLSGDAVGQEHPIVSPCVLGRAPSCAVRIDEESVSREHAKLFERDGVWTIVDLNSRNGLFVNGRRVTKEALKGGEEIVLGLARARFALDPAPDALVEEVELELPQAAPPPPPSPPAPALRSSPRVVLPSGQTRSVPGGAVPVTRTASGAILVGSSRPGGGLDDDLGQRGILFRLAAGVGAIALAAAAFFAARLAVRALAPSAPPPDEAGEGTPPLDQPEGADTPR